MKLGLRLGLSDPVFNRNAAPTDILLSAASIAENNSVNAVVGALSVTDEGDAGPWTYELVAGTGSTDNASFNISGSNLRASSAFNYEVKSSYAVRLRATDSGGLSFDKQFTITVTNVNEAPTDIALSAASIAEGNAVNAVIGAFSTTDPDSGNTFTYSLVSGTGSTDNASFNISGANLRATDVFNFESKSSYAIRVRATDQGGLTVDKQFTITITNANEAPTDIALSNATVPEDLAVGLAIGTLSFTDPDAGATGTFSITVDADNKFDISGTSLIIDHALDYETATSHSVTIRFTDQGGLTYDEAFTITVTNVDESTTPPLDPATVTPVFSGGFDVNPVFGKSNGKGKGQGKSNALAAVVYSIGAVAAGTTYIMRYTADLSLLSHQGKDAAVGFIMKDSNAFHMIGLKGNGSSGQDPTTIQGNWNALGSVTITDKGTNTNGTQYTALVKIAFSADASTYTYSTGTGSDPNTTVWTAEVTNQSVSNITTLTDAENFGLAIFFPASDIGQFSIEVDVWSQNTPLAVAAKSHSESTSDLTTYTFSSMTVGAGKQVVFVGGDAGTQTVSSLTVGGVSYSLIAGSRKQGGSVTVEAWIGDTPGVGTASVVVTWSGAQSRCAIAVYDCLGLPSTTPYAIDTFTPTNGGMDIVINSVNGGKVLGYLYARGSGTPSTTWTGATEDFDLVVEGTEPYHSGATGSPSGDTLTVNANTSSPTANAAGIVLSFASVARPTDASFSSVVLLLGTDDKIHGSTTFIDEATGKSPTVNGCTITTSQKKFGTGSIDCPGNANGMTYADSADWTLAAANSDPYTIECWLRQDTLAANSTICAQYDGVDGNFAWVFRTGGAGSTDEIRFLYSPDGSFANLVDVAGSGADMTTGTWYHVAVDHSAAGKIRLFVNGVMRGSATPANSAISNEATVFSVGGPSGFQAGSDRLDGQIDELRITKGASRYSSDTSFTPPTQKFPRS